MPCVMLCPASSELCFSGPDLTLALHPGSGPAHVSHAKILQVWAVDAHTDLTPEVWTNMLVKFLCRVSVCDQRTNPISESIDQMWHQPIRCFLLYMPTMA